MSQKHKIIIRSVLQRGLIENPLFSHKEYNNVQLSYGTSLKIRYDIKLPSQHETIGNFSLQETSEQDEGKINCKACS